jgi:hypothetical protein
MTTLGNIDVACSICRTVSRQTTIGSTNSIGSPDLDLRPPEMQRSTMAYWLQECPTCGYASGSIDESEADTKAAMDTDEFRAIQSGSLSDTLVGRFLKASIVAEGLENNKSAANYSLWAAWAADDADNYDVAEACRSKSADLYLSLVPDLDKDSEAFTILAAQTVDILRRARRWAEASDLASRLIGRDINPTVRSVVEFGKALASKEDASRYNLSDVK